MKKYKAKTSLAGALSVLLSAQGFAQVTNAPIQGDEHENPSQDAAQHNSSSNVSVLGNGPSSSSAKESTTRVNYRRPGVDLGIAVGEAGTSWTGKIVTPEVAFVATEASHRMIGSAHVGASGQRGAGAAFRMVRAFDNSRNAGAVAALELDGQWAISSKSNTAGARVGAGAFIRGRNHLVTITSGVEVDTYSDRLFSPIHNDRAGFYLAGAFANNLGLLQVSCSAPFVAKTSYRDDVVGPQSVDLSKDPACKAYGERALGERSVVFAEVAIDNRPIGRVDDAGVLSADGRHTLNRVRFGFRLPVGGKPAQ